MGEGHRPLKVHTTRRREAREGGKVYTRRWRRACKRGKELKGKTITKGHMAKDEEKGRM